MDRRSWPWKKKSSEKVVTSDPAGSAGNKVDQDNPKTVNYVQISTESHAHFTELEDQVKTLNENISSLNEKLSLAQGEMTTKDNLVKQHAKVAEEAVSGWEKAEAEALAIKNQLESVTHLKLTAEDRASHLDGALKECMRQIRNVKEESEQKLHDVVLTKTKQWEKMKAELDAKIADLEQELLRASAENTALSRSLQERSNMLVKINEEKSQADAEIEVLKTEIQSYEKEISSLKYEVHIVTKELEIRNEEKNMSLRSSEVANKQHLEGVKKIAKLEAECQRLRGLVRKKLPGPAALAQMKLEVENLGRDYAEPKLRRSPAKSSSPLMAPATEFSLDNIHQYHKETEFLTARLLTMEEETKMLKEALSKRNSELQALRNMCAKQSNKLRSLEAQMPAPNRPKSYLNSSIQNLHVSTEGSLSNASNAPSLTSMSEDGADEEGSCADSWATALFSELPHLKKEKNVDKVSKADSSNHLELMDDFLEMERLAFLSTESSGSVLNSGKIAENAHPSALVYVSKDRNMETEKPDLNLSANMVASNEEASSEEFESDSGKVTLRKLKKRISFIFESRAEDTDMNKILEDMKHVVQDIQDALHQHSVKCIFEETHSADASRNQKCVPEDEETADTDISLIHDTKVCTNAKHPLDKELSKAISQIHEFVVSLGKEATEMQKRFPNVHGLIQKIEGFSVSVNKVLCSEMRLADFVLGLSCVLVDAIGLSLGMQSDKENEGESNNSDYVDKLTLLENNVVELDPAKEKSASECNLVTHSTSDLDNLQEGRLGADFEQKPTLFKCSEEEIEQLKLEKEKMEVDLARCTEDLERTKIQLQETEQLLTEVKSELAASKKSNSLAETQLKCMAESYKSLEVHAQELEKEMNLLHARGEALNTDLQKEKQGLQDSLARCKDLEEQIQRIERCERCATCTHSSSADVVIKTQQEREITAATEKLAECQETIFLLGKQLKALRPSSADIMGSPLNERYRTSEDFFENTPSPSRPNPPGAYSLQESDQTEMERASSIVHRIGGESPLDGFLSSPSDAEGGLITRSPIKSKPPKPRSTGSSSSTAVLPEKHGRSFSRFFSRGKTVH